MRLSITSKIVLVTATGIVIAAVSVMAVIFILMGRAADAQLDSAVRQSKTVVEEYYKVIEANFVNTNKSAAADPALPALIQTGNDAGLVRWSRDLMNDSDADLCTITDAQGVVLVRAHSDQKGDSLADQDMVRAALSGKSISGIVVSKLIPFSIRACVPVVTNGELVGTLSLGVSIASENFVDGLKRLSGLEVTFFRGNTRVMSTITREGRRVVDTQLGNPEIERAVLEQKQTVFRDLVIFAVPYKAAYWPVIDVDNEVVGMWFVGQSIQHALDERRSALLLGLAAMLGITVCLGGVSVFFGHRLARPIKEVTLFSQAIAQGRLDTHLQVRTSDEVGVLADSLRSMVETLKARIAESEQKSREAAEHSEKAEAAMEEANKAKESAEIGQRAILVAAEHVDEVVSRLASVTEAVSVQTMQASRGTEAQRDHVAQSAAAMEEMNATVMEVAKNAGIAAEGSDRAREKAHQGAEIVQASVKSIGAVQQDTEVLRRNMEAFRQQAESIGTIMTVISDIADQTNLLALNAAIEAARAGEAGRGFAVVADEVRKLAEKTMHATQEVGSSISGIQGEARQSIAAVERTTEKLQEATELVQKSGTALADIVEEVNATAAQVSGIATAAEQQSAASEEISGSLDEINRMAGENTAAMHQSSQAVSELAQLTQDLRVLVDKLRTG